MFSCCYCKKIKQAKSKLLVIIYISRDATHIAYCFKGIAETIRGSFLIKFRLEQPLTQAPLSRGRERTPGTRLRLELLMKIKSETCRLVLVSTFSFPFKALLREQETRHAIEDAEIKGLELQAQKEMLQQVSIQPLCGFQ